MARNETPKIDVDGDLKLIYVGELVNEILKRNSFRRER
jgi:UDP-2-acetamido-2,6-beta-L-arabino-hexul-4-ose reductase